MFLSTVIPSAHLNVTKNFDSQPYNFSVPYNFVRGRNLLVSFAPMLATAGNASSFMFTQNTRYPTVGLSNNRVKVLIPDNVTEYTITHEVYVRWSTTANYFSRYTLEIKFDITQGIITVTPTAFVNSNGGMSTWDGDEGCPVLFTVSTML